MTKTASAPGLAAVLVLIPTLWGGTAGAETELSLHTVVVHSDARVEFHLSFSEELDERPEGWREWFCQQAGRSRVCLAADEIRPAGRFQNAFSYPLYVFTSDTDGERSIQRFRFLAKPLGRFPDQERLVDYTLRTDAETKSGRFRLPIHSLSSDHFLQYELPELPVRLEIGEVESTPIDLENVLLDLPLLIRDDLRVTLSKPTLWQGSPRAFLVPPLPKDELEFRLSPSTKARGKIELDASPVPAAALFASFFPYRRQAPTDADDARAGIHDRLTIYIPYRTHGGLERELPVEIPVRFWPSIWALLASVLLGALVGSTLLPLLQRRFEDWPWRVAASLVLAVLTWLIALVLVSFDSEVRILGLELDPYQIVPAALLGALASLGGGRGAPFLKMVPGLRDLTGRS